MILAVHLKQGSLFCGPGMSSDVGVGDWDSFANKAIDLTLVTVNKKKLKTNFNAEHMRSQLNGELCNALNVLNVCEGVLGKKRLLQLMSVHNSFGIDKSGAEVNIQHGALHEELAHIPFLSVWTMNLDQLLEEAFNAENRPYIVVDRLSNANNHNHVFSYEQHNKEMPIYKYHGTCKRVEKVTDRVEVSYEAVLTGKDYAKFESAEPLLVNHLAIALKYSQMVFVGYTFPEQDKHFLKLMKDLAKPELRHLALMSKSEFTEAKGRIKDLNIDVCIVENMSDVVNLIQASRRFGPYFWKNL